MANLTWTLSTGKLNFSPVAGSHNFNKAEYKRAYDALRAAQLNAQTYNFQTEGRLDNQFVVVLTLPGAHTQGCIALMEHSLEDERAAIEAGFRDAPVPVLK